MFKFYKNSNLSSNLRYSFFIPNPVSKKSNSEEREKNSNKPTIPTKNIAK